jgi:uncharacterized protein (TIGR00369 family)
VISAAAERTEGGLAYLRRMVAGELGNVPMGDLLGYRVTAAEPGKVVLTGTPDRRSYNLIGTLHGGWTASILDTALALSALTELDEKTGFTTLDIHINYLRPITVETGEVRAEGRVLHGGRKVALCEATLTDAAGKRLAHGTGACLIFPRGP